jgi:hypothetical protein
MLNSSVFHPLVLTLRIIPGENLSFEKILLQKITNSGNL